MTSREEKLRAGKFPVDVTLVRRLIAAQFPNWQGLELRPVQDDGWDNWTFRLGDRMKVRLPSGEAYAGQTMKESEWLPRLAPHLPFEVPSPVAVGHATDDFPWPWSIYNWIEGDVVTQATEKLRLAQDVARFINSLQMINPAKGPPPGEHNFFRGAHPIKAWGEDARTHIDKLGDLVDTAVARAVLDEAAGSDFDTPVWVHGDVAISNFLTRDGRLSAVLDFGGLSVGDPSCDLVLAWVFFENESREAFRSLVHADGGTWARARAWALWKAARLAVYAQVVNPFELEPLQVISAVIEDHRQSS